MGDITEMMLDGILDYETGEYIGPGVGFPRTYQEPRHKSKYEKNRVPIPCPYCGKKVKKIGLKDHIKDVHGKETEE